MRSGKLQTYLNNLVARELQLGNVACTTSHQITIEHSQNTLVSNDEQIVLLALKLQDDGLEAYG